MRLSDLFSSGQKAYPAKQGQMLEPNRKWYLPVEVTSVRLPTQDMLEAGDWIELIPSIEPSPTLVQIVDEARLFDHTSPNMIPAVFDKNTPLQIGYSSGFEFYAQESPFPYAGQVYRFNGRDWQPLQFFSANASVLAKRSGQVILTQSGTFTVPAGVSQITVSVIAAGGGGGAGATFVGDGVISHYANGGGGGGGGASVMNAVIAVTGNQQIPYIIGSRGVGGNVPVPPEGSNNAYIGTAGTDAGNTSFGSWIEVAGGKGGKGGHSALNGMNVATVGGAGGVVVKNTTNGASFNGGKGGDSAIARPTNPQEAQAGESVNDVAGGEVSLLNGDYRDGIAGGGGASAHAEGGNAKRGQVEAGAQFGGGGSGRYGNSYSYSTSSGYAYAGDGGASAIIISWSIT